MESDTSILRSGLLGLMQFGAKLNIVDSDQKDAMLYAVSSNNMDLVHFLISNAKKGVLNVKHRDAQNKNAIHYLVNPCSFGSYENVEMLEELFNAGYDLTAKDKSGKTPADYAVN